MPNLLSHASTVNYLPYIHLCVVCCADALDKRCEDLQFHNLTLLEDKKQVQEAMDQMRGSGARGAEGGGLERELRELQDSLHQKVLCMYCIHLCIAMVNGTTFCAVCVCRFLHLLYCTSVQVCISLHSTLIYFLALSPTLTHTPTHTHTGDGAL